MSTRNNAVMAEPTDATASTVFYPRSIVVPLDGSSDSESALPLASSLAGLYAVDVRVVHALDADGDTGRAATVFAGYVADLVRAGHLPGGSQYELGEGPPADLILSSVSAEDLLVMATHGKGGFRAAVFGSVADRVARAATAPTIFVPVGAQPGCQADQIETVLVAVDDSDCSAHAADVGRQLAERCGAELFLVTSFMPTPVANGLDAPYISTQLLEVQEEAADSVAAAVAEPGERHEAILGPAVDAIAAVAERAGAELVVAGSSGRGFLARLLGGSVSEGLLHRLDRPLLIVPAPGR
jgi:nucleotide-binding universal stress UspA family protein